MQRFCTKYGKKEENDRCCDQCGTAFQTQKSLDLEQSVSTPETTQRNKKNKGFSNKIVLVAVAVIIIVVGAVGYPYYAARSHVKMENDVSSYLASHYLSATDNALEPDKVDEFYRYYENRTSIEIIDINKDLCTLVIIVPNMDVLVDQAVASYTVDETMGFEENKLGFLNELNKLLMAETDEIIENTITVPVIKEGSSYHIEETEEFWQAMYGSLASTYEHYLNTGGDHD